MDAAQQLVARMSHVEKAVVLMSVNEAAITSLYHDYKRELSSDTVEAGIAEMKRVRDLLSAEFSEKSKGNKF